MTSKERVYAALRHEEPDRVPRFIWFGAQTRQQLNAAYDLGPLELDLRVGNDILQTWLSINGQMERPAALGESFVDEWGITWRHEGIYNAVTVHPLADADEAAIAAYTCPDPLSEARYAELGRLIAEYGESHFIGADVSGSLFEPAYHLRGMENLMVDMAMEAPEADVLLDKLADFTSAVAVESVRRGVDWVWLGDDLGSQQSMLLSADMWRRYFKPRMARIIAAIRAERPDMPIAYHSCGSMYPVIGELLALGINVLNPIQESAAGMDQQAIKAAYGDRLTLFCGPDTQQFLISATPDEVGAKTRMLVDTLGAGGGYIFGVSHHIQPDTPEENIRAMLMALHG